LIPIDSPPYYAATVVLSDIGTKGGLVTDTNARVLRPDNIPIEGLYATGNTMAAMSGGSYPGAGTPIGSSVVFGYRAALDLAGESQQ
ncbi:FAD-binding protein, partial [Nocardia alni]|uniref:FAD-binding protein n=1 Tax=Nocardia alni TaxID=2815723 RepID=UPI001C23682A